MDKKEFWIRLSLYILFTFLIPIILIFCNYKAWKNGGFTIAAIFAVGILILGMLKVGSYIKDALWYNFVVQIILAITSSLWIIGLFLLANIIGVNVNVVKNICLISFFSVIIGKIINPLPKWVELKKIQKIKDSVNK